MKYQACFFGEVCAPDTKRWQDVGGKNNSGPHRNRTDGKGGQCITDRENRRILLWIRVVMLVCHGLLLNAWAFKGFDDFAYAFIVGTQRSSNTFAIFVHQCYAHPV